MPMGVKLRTPQTVLFEAVDKINTSFTNLVKITREEWE